MRYETNECVGCAVPSYPCMGDACPNRHVVHLECDECGCEEEVLYDYEGRELCAECVLNQLTEITC